RLGGEDVHAARVALAVLELPGVVVVAEDDALVAAALPGLVEQGGGVPVRGQAALSVADAAAHEVLAAQGFEVGNVLPELLRLLELIEPGVAAAERQPRLLEHPADLPLVPFLPEE